MFFKKKTPKVENVVLNTPFAGELILLENAPDPVFAQKMMGDGFAVIPTDGKLTAPVTGEIIQVFPTQHAIGFKTAEGLEVLLHIGVDTVELNGEGFNIHAAAGDKVKAGDDLGSVDFGFIKSKEKEITSMLVVTNFGDVVAEMTTEAPKTVGNNETGATLKLK